MTNLPPSRTADRIIIRLPDGMRDRLHERAQANGRTMTAEVVELLQAGLDDKDDSTLLRLSIEAMKIVSSFQKTRDALAADKARLELVKEEIRKLAGDRIEEGGDPVMFAAKMIVKDNTLKKTAMSQDIEAIDDPSEDGLSAKLG